MRTDLLGKTHEQRLPAEEAALLTRAKRRVLEQGESVHEEMDFTFGGEERRHVRETIEPLRDHAGKIVGVIGAATDITEQQRTQRQLTDELHFRERMMGILGHDLRNPLNAVIDGGRHAAARADDAAEARDHLLRLRRAAGRMQEMIDTLLDFTRARFMGKVRSRACRPTSARSPGARRRDARRLAGHAIELRGARRSARRMGSAPGCRRPSRTW